MQPNCHRCVMRGQPGLQWHATGRFGVSRRRRRQAQLQCETCGYLWMCGLPQALDAANAERGDTDEALPSAAPQPSLPATRIPPRSQPTVRRGFTPLRDIVKDFKTKQTGEDVA